MAAKEKEVAKMAEKLSSIQEEGQKDTEALVAAQQHFNAVSAGLSTNEDGEEATLAGQMMACKNDMSKADTEAKQVSAAFFFAEHGGFVEHVWPCLACFISNRTPDMVAIMC